MPCTRIDIKDIAYFMKDWKADYQRHASLEFPVGNIKGFSDVEEVLYITHGYGYYLPIHAREVFVQDDRYFGAEWSENIKNPEPHQVNTLRWSAGLRGVSSAALSEYLDQHIEGNFEGFVDSYFEGTPFITDMVKTVYRFWCRERTPVIRKSLKLLLAYNLTQHITMLLGRSDEELIPGRIYDGNSKIQGKIIAPVMINFQVKVAMADMWRELQKDVLEELSQLYSSVYSRDKLKHWPTIFMVATILLTVWEEMQFDCHYRVQVSSSCPLPPALVLVAHGVCRMRQQLTNSAMTWSQRQLESLSICSSPSPRSSRLCRTGTRTNIATFSIPILPYVMR